MSSTPINRVEQSDRATDSGSVGRRFDSYQAPQIFLPLVALIINNLQKNFLN